MTVMFDGVALVPGHPPEGRSSYPRGAGYLFPTSDGAVAYWGPSLSWRDPGAWRVALVPAASEDEVLATAGSVRDRDDDGPDGGPGMWRDNG